MNTLESAYLFRSAASNNGHFVQTTVTNFSFKFFFSVSTYIWFHRLLHWCYFRQAQFFFLLAMPFVRTQSVVKKKSKSPKQKNFFEKKKSCVIENLRINGSWRNLWHNEQLNETRQNNLFPVFFLLHVYLIKHYIGKKNRPKNSH